MDNLNEPPKDPEDPPSESVADQPTETQDEE